MAVKKKVNTNINWTAWRPSVMTESLLLKLEEAFKISLTDEEACLEVGITTTPFYDYCAKNPQWAKRKEVLKKTPNIQAKKNWVKEIKGANYASSKEWLERKAKDEFSTKEIIDQTTKQVNYSKEEWDDMSDDDLDLIIND